MGFKGWGFRGGIGRPLSPFGGGESVARLPAPTNIVVDIVGSGVGITFTPAVGSTGTEIIIAGFGTWQDLAGATSYNDVFADGSYTAQLRGYDGGAVPGSAATISFTVDTVLPTVTSAAINATGNVLTVTFSEPVTGSTGITLGGVTSTPTYSGGAGTNVLTFSLSNVINNAQSPNLNYSTGTGNILDASGNELAAITTGTIANGSTVDGVPPYLVSAEINPAGDTLVVVLSEPCTGHAGFSLSGAGGAALTYATGTSTLVFTLSPVVTDPRVPTLNYTAGNVEDLAGNDLADFSGEAVDNQSTVPGTGPELVGTYSLADGYEHARLGYGGFTGELDEDEDQREAAPDVLRDEHYIDGVRCFRIQTEVTQVALVASGSIEGTGGVGSTDIEWDDLPVMDDVDYWEGGFDADAPGVLSPVSALGVNTLSGLSATVGTHTFRVRAVSVSGVVGAYAESEEFTVTAPPEPTWYGPTITIGTANTSFNPGDYASGLNDIGNPAGTATRIRILTQYFNASHTLKYAFYTSGDVFIGSGSVLKASGVNDDWNEYLITPISIPANAKVLIMTSSNVALTGYNIGGGSDVGINDYSVSYAGMPANPISVSPNGFAYGLHVGVL